MFPHYHLAMQDLITIVINMFQIIIEFTDVVLIDEDDLRGIVRSQLV